MRNRRGAEVLIGQSDGTARAEVEIVAAPTGGVVGVEEVDGFEAAVRLHVEPDRRLPQTGGVRVPSAASIGPPRCPFAPYVEPLALDV